MKRLTIPSTLSNFSLSQTLTSGQTFRWLVNPPQIKSKKPLSKPDTNSFYLPTTINNNPIIYKVIQRDNQIFWNILNQTDVSENTQERYLEKRLGFNRDYHTIYEKASKTDVANTKTIFEKDRHLSLIQDPPFETLISFLTSPQATIDRIYNIQRQLEQAYGKEINTEDGVFHIFPTPSELETSEDKLRDLNLGYRAKYVDKSVKIVLDGHELPPQNTDMSTLDLQNYLQEYYGVGPKVADCVLLYSYNRTEVLPVDSRILKFVQNYYDDTIETPESAKQLLEDHWPSKYLGYYQLLAYDYMDSQKDFS